MFNLKTKYLQILPLRLFSESRLIRVYNVCYKGIEPCLSVYIKVWGKWKIYTVGTVTELGNGYINLCKYVCIRPKLKKKCLFATSSCPVI